jgi:Tfp pilus assembly protein PilV
MIEVLVSLGLITVGVLSLLTLLPAGWRLSGTSDMLGRAAGILQAELERNEIMIMNGKNLNIPLNPPEKTVYGSGKETAQPGDIRYTVATTVVENVGGNFLVRVTVTWPGNTTGIAESVIVGRQVSFAQ